VEIGGKSYTWTFIRADVKFPILGVDFLRKFNLVVDVGAEQLLPGATAMAARPSCRRNSSLVAAAAAEKAVLNKFPGVIQPLSGASHPAHGVEHQIVTAGPPTAAKFRRLNNSKLAAVKEEFNKMLQAGIIRGRPASGPALST
jgi:hypothetical protein